MTQVLERDQNSFSRTTTHRRLAKVAGSVLAQGGLAAPGPLLDDRGIPLPPVRQAKLPQDIAKCPLGGRGDRITGVERGTERRSRRRRTIIRTETTQHTHMRT